jgi:hypothetical protein
LDWAVALAGPGLTGRRGFVVRILREVADVLEIIFAGDDAEAAEAVRAAGVDRLQRERMAALMASHHAPTGPEAEGERARSRSPSTL